MSARSPQSAKARADREAVRLPPAAPGMRIGLLGGSFDPAHAAHREISLTALKRLGLDRVWWAVTPRNPLKTATEPAGLAARVAAARRLANHPRIAVTGFSAGSPYTIDLLTALKRRYPGVNFVWLMGADNLAQFHRWRAWEEIFALVPVAVVDRPGFRLKARAGRAAQRFAAYMVDDSDAGGLARLIPPAWIVLTHRLSPLSSTALRAKQARQAKRKQIKRAKQKQAMKAKAKQKRAEAAAKQARRTKRAKPAPARRVENKAKTAKTAKKAAKKAARPAKSGKAKRSGKAPNKAAGGKSPARRAKSRQKAKRH